MESISCKVLVTVITFATFLSSGDCNVNSFEADFVNMSYINSSNEKVRHILGNYFKILTSTHTPPIVYATDSDVVQTLLTVLANRLRIVPDMARYKWKNGIHTLITQERIDEIVNNSRKLARENNISPEYAEQMALDLIDGSNVIEYTLKSNWYADFPEADGIFPEGDDINIDELRNKLDEAQGEIMKVVKKLKDFRKDRDCLPTVGKNIFRNELAKSKVMFRVAMCVALTHFCEAYIFHAKPGETVTVKVDNVNTRRVIYAQDFQT